MSDIRFNNWYHQSGTGGVYQDGSGNVGIRSSVPTSNLDVAGTVTATTFVGNVTGNATGITTTQITVGDKFINSSGVGLGQTTTAGRNAGIGTAEGTIIYNSSLAEVQVYKSATGWTNISDSFIQATGGTVNEYTQGSTVYRSHTFTSSGTFDVTSAPAGSSVETLVVGGGGGGGTYPLNGAGGGGAGGLLEGTFTISASPGSYTITVGAGGAVAWPSGNAYDGDNTTIANPSITTITANGGGGGAGDNTLGRDGGSGGGSGGNDLTNPSATQTPYSSSLLGYGNQGGTASPGGMGGGGGGAGGAGVDGTVSPNSPPRSGPGRSNSFNGTSATYAVGGGVGPFSPGVNVDDAAINTGNGGTSKGNPGYAGAGGSGIVVIRYQIGSLGGTAKATGGNVSFANGKTIHTFLSTGTFAITDAGLTSVDYLVVAGGGAGSTGTNGGGGGGAGGFRTGTGLPVSNSSPYTVTVGAGGERSVGRGLGTNGTDSTFSTITSTGGGRGGGPSPLSGTDGLSGGSGGGGAYNGDGGSSSPVTSPVQGYAGGTGAQQLGLPPTNDQGGGGGGATEAGQPGEGSGGAGGRGGNGASSSISGITQTYAGGGGGASNNTNTRSVGGSGGGGTGAGQNPQTNRIGAPGGSNTGGGGGAGNGGTGGGSGAGGSGIVIISYPT